MGTLAGHLIPGAAFTVLGLWHLFNTSAAFRHFTGAATSSSRTWFPCPFIKYFELVVLLLLSLLATVFLLLSPSSTADIEHAAMFLHLVIYSAAALAADILPSPSSAASIIGALAASAFAQELLLLHFHSIDHSGLEGHYHHLMVIAVAACLVSTVAAAAFPKSHLAAVVRSAAIVLQGLWFMCTGLALWGPTWLFPAKCAAENGEAAACAGAAAAMANVQFSFIVAGVAALTTGACLLPDRKGVEYRKLGEAGLSLDQ
ncbi:hypothetical protein KSP40_PGU013866 [Platanthera guangdongensis]|uniref:Uncharacterized protein n=1 Tax=Platanthera guangdongensis TaxID=2320717 RepID=A0ABR2MRN4_9ASPA